MKAIYPSGIALLILASACWADVVELKTGQRIEGTLKQAGEGAVTLEVGGQRVMFEQDKVRAIYFGAPPAAPAATPTAATEALRALRALESVTSAGVSYRDYAPRVSEAKIQVDRYLQEPAGGDVDVRTAVNAAMHYHVLASTLWNAQLTTNPGGYERVARDPAIMECEATRGVVERERERRAAERAKKPGLLGTLFGGSHRPLESTFGEATDDGIVLAVRGIPSLWSCASAKLEEANRLTK